VYSHHKLHHEFPNEAEPRLSYIVCALPRSGSSLLCDVLANTELAGAPAEYFEPNVMSDFSKVWGARTFDDYLAALLVKKTSPNGVFGVKALYPQLQDAFHGRNLHEVFPSLRFVYVTRADHLRQAVSFARAIQTDKWADHHPARTTDIAFDADQIQELLDWIEREERLWEEFFEREPIAPLRLVYEQFAGSLDAAVAGVLDFLGIEAPSDLRLEPTLTKQADDVSELWVRRYREEEVG
jgi:LPS sulfotransferase NodH